MRVLGIDVGLGGGFVTLDANAQILFKEVMPRLEKTLDVKGICEIIKSQSPDAVYLEKLHARPGQSVQAMYNFGVSSGVIHGILAAFNLKYTLVPPQTWQKLCHEGVDKSQDPKTRSKIAAQRLFPSEDFLATSRSKVAHDGLIDAALIAYYGLKKR